MKSISVSLFKRKPVSMYFLFSFIFSWLILSPGVASYAGILELGIDGTVLTILGGFGPLFSAILVTALISGRRGLRNLFSGFFIWRLSYQPRDSQ